MEKLIELTFRKLFDRIRGLGANGHEAQEENGLKLPLSLRPVTIATMNQKGGCGKTTTVVNLSAALASTGYRVLVVDMDPQAHASLGFGISIEQFRRSIYDLLLDANATFGDVMRSTTIGGLDVLPSSMRLAAAQLELANIPRGEAALKRSLASVEKSYDFILIDCPPTLNLHTMNALAYAAKVLIPVQTNFYALEGMKELFRTIEAIKSRFNPQLEVLGILATIFDRRMHIAAEMLEALRAHFQSTMFETVVHSSVKLVEAPMLQQSVITYAPRSKSANEYRHLAEEVVHLVTQKN